ncbi:hypothetical protein TNCV_2584451 [Trichonephila clavipes]|nr:hypothetical protein TNCV_2584451 [Trichonephila clavipes]
MVEHFVMGLKTSPNHIGLGSALETGGWQFIDQHGYMRRLNQVNLSRFHRSQAKVSNHGLQPPEIIDLHTEQRIGELLTKVFPDHHSLDILRVRAFARSEPKDVSSDYVELEASKGAFIQALWMPNPAYTVWHIRLETTGSAKLDHVDSIGSSGGCYAEKGPDTVSPTYDPSVRYTGQKRHTVAMSFTCNVCCNTWM